MSHPCDPVSQSCGAPAKCTITGYDSSAIPSCVAVTGSLAEGTLCVRGGDGGIGNDDCTAGLLCSALGGLGTTEATHVSHCWKYCSADSGCGAGKKCITLNETPVIGVCVPTCTPFTACAGGFNCSFILPDVDSASAYLGCREPGNRSAGTFCDDGTQCAADLICNPISMPKTCAPLCDATHPCALGACVGIPGGSGGVCLF